MSDIQKVKTARPLSDFTAADALMFKERVIKSWKPWSDVWALKYGDEALGSLCTLGSLYITYFFRKELKLRPYARISCYSPVVGICTVSTVALQEALISADVYRKKSCPLCVTTKATLLQAGMGFLFPVLSASLICFNFADRLLTYPIPPLLSAPKEAFLLVKKILSKGPRRFLFICGINMFAASLITFYKVENFHNLDLQTRKSFTTL